MATDTVALQFVRCSAFDVEVFPFNHLSLFTFHKPTQSLANRERLASMTT
jgi:hypothetical protein